MNSSLLNSALGTLGFVNNKIEARILQNTYTAALVCYRMITSVCEPMSYRSVTIRVKTSCRKRHPTLRWIFRYRNICVLWITSAELLREQKVCFRDYISVHRTSLSNINLSSDQSVITIKWDKTTWKYGTDKIIDHKSPVVFDFRLIPNVLSKTILTP